MPRIIQLSDCHVSGSPDARYRGIDPRSTLRALLPEVRKWQPELLVLTGDLAEAPSPEAYAFLYEQVTSLGVPVLTIPGNHDDPVMQQQAFPRTAVNAALTWTGGAWQIVLLNSAAEGRIDGVLDDTTMQGLATALAGHDGPSMVMLHHQPVSTGSPWIDRYALEKPERFWSVIDAHPRVRAVCWGHIHHDYSDRRGEVVLLGAPSTAANSLPGQQRFTADPAGAACRWLKLGLGGGLETGLLRA